jgi:hypothetical protein
MHMGVPAQEIPRALETGHGPRDGGAGSRGGLEEILDRLVGQAGQAGEALPPTEVRSETPRQRGDDVAVRHRFEDLVADELAEGRLALGVTGGAETALFTREREQVLMAAVRAAHAGKPPGEDSTPLEALQGAGDNGPEGTASRGITVVVHIKEGVRVVCNKLPEWRGFGPARAINRRAFGGSRGVRRLTRENGESTGHRRTTPF